jgi:hypothetical protein
MVSLAGGVSLGSYPDLVDTRKGSDNGPGGVPWEIIAGV